MPYHQIALRKDKEVIRNPPRLLSSDPPSIPIFHLNVLLNTYKVTHQVSDYILLILDFHIASRFGLFAATQTDLVLV